MRTVTYPPAEFFRRVHQRRGPVVQWSTPALRVAYLLGPEANAFVFAHDELFRWREAFKNLIPVDGDTALIVSDGPAHSRRRALVRPSLHHRQVAGYVDLIAESAAEALDPVPAYTAVDVYALLRRAIRRSTIRALFGDRILAREDEVGRLLQPLFDLTDHIQTVELHGRVGTPLWRRAMRARASLDALVYAEIARVRADPGAAEQARVLGTLVHSRDETGGVLTDQEVRDQVVTMIAAGYETTSAAMAWTIYALACRPDLMGDAIEEVRSVCGGRRVRAEDLPRLNLISRIVSESLRLYPPAVVSARSVAVGFEFAGATVREGTIALISPYVTHRDPAIYPDPMAFRPERWAQDPRRPGSEYLPFGGGAHRCIGSSLATTELAVMLAELLARGRYRVLDTRVRATGLAALRPRGGLRIMLDPRA